MNNIYLLASISRQGHLEAVKKETIQKEKEPYYIGFILEVRGIHPGMGLRKMYNQFGPEEIGRDAFIALGLKEGFRLNPPNKPYRTTFAIKCHRYSNLLVNQRFTDVNQVWVSDIYYFPLEGRHYYGVLIMDVYSRRIIGYSMADNMRAENNIKALQMALTLRGVSNYDNKLIHHSDRGSQYISDTYTDLLTEYNIQISVCSNVLENAHSERCNGIIKNEYLHKYNITSGEKLINVYIEKAVNAYNNRYHNSLKFTPIEFESHIKSIPLENREILEIFTLNNTNENPLQLKLDL